MSKKHKKNRVTNSPASNKDNVTSYTSNTNWNIFKVSKEELEKKERERLKNLIPSKDVPDDFRFDYFEWLCNLSQSQLKDNMYDMLQGIYGEEKVFKEDGFILAVGDVPVMLCAHMDMVHTESPKEYYYSQDYGTITTKTGIGGDDRCGIYMISDIITRKKCWVLLCEDEEIGCVGASKFAKLVAKGTYHTDMFKDIKYIIELDRRGKQDAVYYDLDNVEFEDFVTESSDGYYKTEWGSCSDISTIAPTLGVAAVNLSVGYNNEHTKEETVDIDVLFNNIDHTEKVIDAHVNVEKPFEYKEYKSIYKYGGKYGCHNGYNYEYDYGAYDDYDFGNYSLLTGNSAKEGSDEYEVVFEDWDGNYCVDYINADGIDEAIGKFVQLHPEIPYEHVYSVEVTDRREVIADKYYINGNEIAEKEINFKEAK